MSLVEVLSAVGCRIVVQNVESRKSSSVSEPLHGGGERRHYSAELNSALPLVSQMPHGLEIVGVVLHGIFERRQLTREASLANL